MEYKHQLFSTQDSYDKIHNMSTTTTTSCMLDGVEFFSPVENDVEINVMREFELSVYFIFEYSVFFFYFI